MKLKTILFLLCFLPFISLGQNDDLKDEILNYEDEDIKLIENGRTLLLEKFLNRDLAKVKEIKDYLILKTSDNYTPFFKDELTFIMYWTREYDDLIYTIQEPDTIIAGNEFYYDGAVRMDDYDLLTEGLRNHSYQYLDDLVISIKDSKISPIKKDFLTLYLKSRFVDLYSEDPIVNKLADQFLTQYPNSRYEDFVRKNIRYKTIPSNWAIGYEIFAGYGIHKEEFASNFRNSIPFGFNVDVEFNRLIMNGRMTFGATKTLKDIKQDDVTWDKGSSSTILNPELSFGYFLKYKRLKIYPFAGFSWMSIEPSEDDKTDFPELEDFKIGGTIAYNLGINLDIKLKDISHDRLYIANEGNTFIRLRYSYCLPQFEADLSGFSGNIHNITIGLGRTNRWYNRDL